MIVKIKRAAAIVLLLAIAPGAAASSEAAWVLACQEENDLARVMKANGLAIQRCVTAAEAVRLAPAGSGVFVLADGYPRKTTDLADALLETDQWDELFLKNILGNFRTTGRDGFRHRALNSRTLSKVGWEYYNHEPFVHLAPHYQAWIWASYLWLYDKTRDPVLLDRTRRGIRRMMEAYPDNWTWTNGIQQERGRMLLTLAWLIRVEDRPEYREWLRRLAEDMRRCQDPCGAIREELGPLDHGAYRPPRSNAEYGKHEASLIQGNGDPIADLLYTCNFTLLGLHEAHAATDEPLYREMADRLAEFVVRVQIRSETHPELDGGWFRAFDDRRWDYLGSNADSGWGAWAIEVGWTQAWIPTTLAMRELKLNLWDLTARSKIARHWPEIRKAMLTEKNRAAMGNGN